MPTDTTQGRTANAHRVTRRLAERRKAAELEARGWTCTPPADDAEIDAIRDRRARIASSGGTATYYNGVDGGVVIHLPTTTMTIAAATGGLTLDML